MSWYDSVTDLFSSSSDTSQSSPAPSVDPNQMLSAHYSLANLTATAQPLSQPNLPSNPAWLDNLRITADVVEQISAAIGPVNIISGFRSKELQNALAAKGEPVASGTSFHEIGRAVDVYPTTMSIADYFGKLLADDNLRPLFAEIAIKPAQNSLHLAVNTPDDQRAPKVLGLNEEGVYKSLDASEIAAYVKPYLPANTDATDYAAAKLVTANYTPLIAAMIAAGLGIAYLAFGRGKSRS